MIQVRALREFHTSFGDFFKGKIYNVTPEQLAIIKKFVEVI